MLRASRDDDVAAKASAVRIVRERLIAFVLSAAMVGAGGGLYAEFLGSMTVNQFSLEMTVVTLAMLVVGGIGSLSGAIVGVVVVTFVIQFLRTFEHGVSIHGVKLLLPSGSQEIGLGVVMALILILRPTGLTRGREIGAPHGARARGRPPASPSPCRDSDRPSQALESTRP
jgi:branched-chain amino acid transport system permease protein